jgi:hypothetical protein
MTPLWPGRKVLVVYTGVGGYCNTWKQVRQRGCRQSTSIAFAGLAYGEPMIPRKPGRLVLATLILSQLGACVTKASCSRMLEHQWVLGALRGDDLDVRRQMTVEEERDLRRVIRRCESVRTEFDLTGGLMEQGAWATVTVIDLAVDLNDPKLLEQLVAEGHPIDGLPNSLDMSTLHLATYLQRDKAFLWLLEKGVDPNPREIDGVTPLMMAAMRPQVEMASIRALLEAGADVNAVDVYGRNALIYAIRSQRFDNASLLASAGTDLK